MMMKIMKKEITNKIMGIEIKTISTKKQYNELKTYYDEIYNLYRMNPQNVELLTLCNKVKAEINIWENK